MHAAAIVPAAGRGERLGGDQPKALLPIGGVPLVARAVRMLRDAGIADVVVAAPAAYLDAFRVAVPDAVVIEGGADRQDSVRHALAVVDSAVDVVLVHDAARGLAPVEVARRVLQTLADGADAVVPVVAIPDTVNEVDSDARAIRTLDREKLRLVQTPQGFRRSVLDDAHTKASVAGRRATDDASLVEALGVAITTCAGADEAFKVTRPFDVLVAEAVVR